MVLDWFNAGEAVTFAQEIVRTNIRLFPLADQRGKAIPAKEYKNKFDSLIAHIQTFSSKHKLNTYKKAKLLNTIKWEMKGAGHEEVIIKDSFFSLRPCCETAVRSQHERL
jgi:hypothetical protein